MKAIVTTTINPPTEALLAYAKMEDWQLYIVGDQKTPHGAYSDSRPRIGKWKYMHPIEQAEKYPDLSFELGWNNIQRRNIGFLEAVKDGAEIIATVDDDSVPLPGWGENLLIGQTLEMNYYEMKEGAPKCPLFDPLIPTNLGEKYWHRGIPLCSVPYRFDYRFSRRNIEVKVQADFWNGKPDVDAVSRMMHGDNDRTIKSHMGFPFSCSKTIFSSQNAFLHRSVMPYYCVLPNCDRMDDIWGSIVLQHETGCNIVFSGPSTIHKRNWHDPTSDIKRELIGQQGTLKLVESLDNLPPLSRKFYNSYKEAMLNVIS